MSIFERTALHFSDGVFFTKPYFLHFDNTDLSSVLISFCAVCPVWIDD